MKLVPRQYQHYLFSYLAQIDLQATGSYQTIASEIQDALARCFRHLQSFLFLATAAA